MERVDGVLSAADSVRRVLRMSVAEVDPSGSSVGVGSGSGSVCIRNKLDRVGTTGRKGWLKVEERMHEHARREPRKRMAAGALAAKAGVG